MEEVRPCVLRSQSVVTSTTCDKENRLKTTTFAGETAENFYDEVGSLERVLKPKGNDTTRTYDGLNRLTSVTEGGLLTTGYTFDANGNLRTQTDPRGNVVEYTYDELNRKTQHIQYKPSGNLLVNYDLYDAEGNLKQMTDAKGQVFSYEYDELGRRTRTIYPVVATPFLTPQEVTTAYDANNNVETVTETKKDTGGATITDVTSNTWDNFDRLKTSTQRGMTISYGYDNNGNRTSVSTVNGSTTYTYDHRNRLQTAVVGTDVTTYTYTPDGLTDNISYPNGASAKTTYFPTNRVETITHKDAGAAVISSFIYQYDPNGNRSQQVEVQAGTTQTTDYHYGTLDRLKDFTLTSGADTTVTTYTFEGYNRKTETVTENGVTTASKTYDYDETDWLTQITNIAPATPVTITYGYDDNGNTVQKSDSSKPGEDVSFDYDAANHLVQTTQGASILGKYDYNADGMRVRHYGSERGDVSYYYDDGAVLEEYVDGAGGGLLAHYRYGDRLLSLDAPSDGGVQYYHHDALGSTVNLTDSVGSAKVSYTLDPWGHIRSQQGTSVNRQIFTGQEHDENTGLIYFGARYYDPDSARFIGQDSYLGEPGTPPSLHRYLYAYSNPTVYVDLMGFASEDNLWMPKVRYKSPTLNFFAPTAAAIASGGSEAEIRRAAEYSLESTSTKIGLVTATALSPLAVGAAPVLPELGMAAHVTADVAISTSPALQTVATAGVTAASAAHITGLVASEEYRAEFMSMGPIAPLAETRAAAEVIASSAKSLAGGLKGVVGGARLTGESLNGLAEGVSQYGDDAARSFYVGEKTPDGRVAGFGPGAALKDGPDFSSIDGALRTGLFRDSGGRLRNKNGTFAYDGGPKPRTSGGGNHGNTRRSDVEATLYGKYDADDNFLKWGIAGDHATRYSRPELGEGGYVVPYRRGPRDVMLDKERRLVERAPGPENNEPWAGWRNPSHLNYRKK